VDGEPAHADAGGPSRASPSNRARERLRCPLRSHPENVLLSPDGPVVIDWTNARGGQAAQNIAMTWLILRTSAGLPGRLLARLFCSRVGWEVVSQGLTQARALRLADPNVSEPERARARRAIPEKRRWETAAPSFPLSSPWALAAAA
jgi:hypothetical protein